MQPPCREKELQTIATVAAMLLLLSLLFGWKAFSVAAVLLLAVSLISRKAASFLSRAWLRLAELLGWVNSRVLLGAAFYLVLTPLALAYRIKAGDLLRLKASGVESFYVIREHLFTKGDLEKMW